MEKFSEDILTRDGLCRLIGGFDDLWLAENLKLPISGVRKSFMHKI